MANDFYLASGAPSTNSFGFSASMRAEFNSINTGFDKLPALTGNAGKWTRVNSTSSGLEVFDGAGTYLTQVNAATSYLPRTGGTLTGDITTYRAAAPTTGVLYLGNSGNNYLFFDGASYQLANAQLTINGSAALHAANIGTYSPSLTGTGATGTWGIALAAADTRSTATGPSLGLAGARFDFKQNAFDGLDDGGYYHGVMTFQQFSDSSGGGARQLGFTDNNNLWIRGSGTLLTAYGSWKKLIDSASISTYPLSTFTNDATLGAGQAWVDVTGTRASAAAYTNATGRPVMVACSINQSSGATVVVGGVTIINLSASAIFNSVSFIVPAGRAYSVTSASGISNWSELR